MVIRSNSEGPSEAQTMKPKKYVVVKNHVREIIAKEVENNIQENNSDDNNQKNEKIKKKHKKHKNKQQSAFDDNVSSNRSKRHHSTTPDSSNEISKNDLEELKSVYQKCKAVLIHIESKYGHLLDLDSEYSTGKRKWEQDHECNCSLNKKIIFNDDGQQGYQESNLENHICPKRLRSDTKYFPEKYQNIQIEEEENLNNLPESIQELTEILKNPLIPSSLRYAVIEKIKSIRQENLNMIRFDRHTLIEKLKSNPDEVMDFKGTNISSLEGYPTK